MDLDTIESHARSIEAQTATRAAWLAGDDPTEHRGA